ncbi:MAG: RNA-directed DNA polymerase [Haemophilus haemolyticus]|nr:RNA-directed DNA polymerase [Haemophilus haemolyticus]
METWSAHQLFKKASSKLDNISAQKLVKYYQNLQSQNLPVIFTLRHLSKITNTNYLVLRKTIMRRRELANYRMFSIKKRSGGWRYIHQVNKELFKVQQFINSEILQKIQPHPASFAFHSNGGIKRCALKHCGARWLFQYDLKDFFYTINEKNVYDIFHNQGYRSLLAFELARICTTTRLPKCLQKYITSHAYCVNYKFYDNHMLGILPQGAPTSPMLSNLATFKLDTLLTNLAKKHDLVYTRYADDITFSTYLDKRKEKFKIHRDIIKTIIESGFIINNKKTRIAGPGARKIVLGLLVDGDRPRIPKETYKRIERLLYASNKYGLIETAKHENFDTPYGFYNHISGLMSFVKDVDYERWKYLNSLFSNIRNPLNDLFKAT